jgi:pilus assembly protein Flp/PilA
MVKWSCSPGGYRPLRSRRDGSRLGVRFRRRSIRWIERLLRSDDGPTAVEYAVMLSLIVLVCMSAIKTLGSNASAKFSTVGASLATGAGS